MGGRFADGWFVTGIPVERGRGSGRGRGGGGWLRMGVPGQGRGAGDGRGMSSQSICQKRGELGVDRARRRPLPDVMLLLPL